MITQRPSELYNRLDTVGGLAFMAGKQDVLAEVESLKDGASRNLWEQIEDRLPALEREVGVGLEGVPPVEPSEPVARVPSFDAPAILAAMVGQKFRVMTTEDFYGYAGATPGSTICYDLDGWVVIVAPGIPSDGEDALVVHAYFYDPDAADMSADLAYRLLAEGWDRIN